MVMTVIVRVAAYKWKWPSAWADLRRMPVYCRQVGGQALSAQAQELAEKQFATPRGTCLERTKRPTLTDRRINYLTALGHRPEPLRLFSSLVLSGCPRFCTVWSLSSDAWSAARLPSSASHSRKPCATMPHKVFSSVCQSGALLAF